MSIFDKFAVLAQSYDTILGLALMGSRVQNRADEWSDWDCVIVCADETNIQGFVTDLSWTNTLGELLASSQSQTQFTHTLRLCFSDFQRLDLVFTTQDMLTYVEQWPSIPFRGETQIIFAHLPEIEEKLTSTYPSPEFQSFPTSKLNNLANDFYFKAQLAVFKILRDEQAKTTYHQTGGWGNLAVDNLPVLQNYQAEEMLAKIETLSHLFDDYARQLYPAYMGKSDILHAIIEKVRSA